MLNFLYNLLYSTVSVVVGVFFILLGLLAIFLPWSPHIRTDFIQFILENSIAISLFGFGFAVMGAIVLIEVYLTMRRKVYYLRKGKKSIVIDEEIMKSYLDSYWKQAYPLREIPSELVVKKDRLKVVAELPFAPKQEQQGIVEQVQSDLQDLFFRLLGYSQGLSLAITFQPSPKKE